jgi:hypothetical protein
MENLDIFNLSLDNFKTEEKSNKQGSDVYKTDPKLSKDSIYRSLVRFIPNLNNPKKSIIRKYSYWLEDSAGAGFYADCPSSNPGDKSIIQDTFWKLFKSESAFEKKQAERMKRKEYYYAYVLIVKDAQRPELENTVQICRFPRAVKKLIDAQIEPSAEDIEMGVEATNIFDFFNGKDFSLKVTMKGGYWNYDECKFANSPAPVKLSGSSMENTEECRKMILSTYEGVTPLEDNEFKPWSADQQTKVYNYIAELTGSNPGAAIAAVTAPSQPRAESMPMAGTTVNQTVNTTPNIETATKQAGNTNDSEIEDWLKEFDIK